MSTWLTGTLLFSCEQHHDHHNFIITITIYHDTISNILRASIKPSFRLSRSFPCISSQLPGLDLCCDGLVHFDYDVGDHDCDEDDADDEDDWDDEKFIKGLPACLHHPLCEVFNYSLRAPEKDHGDRDTSKVVVMSWKAILH